MPPKRKTAKKTAPKKVSKAKHVKTVKKVIAELKTQGPVVVAPGVMNADAAVVIPATASQPAMVVPAAPSGIPLAPPMASNMQVARAESNFEKMLAGRRSGLSKTGWAEDVKTGRFSNATHDQYKSTHKSADEINALYHPVTHPELAGVSCNPGYYWDTVKQNCEPRKSERRNKYEAICGPGFTYSVTEKKCVKNSQQYN